MIQEKHKIRKIYAEKRANMPPTDVDAKSKEIKKHLLALPEYQNSISIHTFIGSLPGEVRTKPLIEHALSENKNVMIPIYHGVDKPPSHSLIHDLDSLEMTQVGIEQPTEDSVIPSEVRNAGIILVPCIAVDKSGNRIGMGGGFYDRILNQLSITKIALAFDFQFIDNLPAEEHDIKIDIVVTEEGVTRIKE